MYRTFRTRQHPLIPLFLRINPALVRIHRNKPMPTRTPRTPRTSHHPSIRLPEEWCCIMIWRSNRCRRARRRSSMHSTTSRRGTNQTRSLVMVIRRWMWHLQRRCVMFWSRGLPCWVMPRSGSTMRMASRLRPCPLTVRWRRGGDWPEDGLYAEVDTVLARASARWQSDFGRRLARFGATLVGYGFCGICIPCAEKLDLRSAECSICIRHGTKRLLLLAVISFAREKLRIMVELSGD